MQGFIVYSDVHATRPKVLYLASSQYSGSTLASFLLNTHSRFTTVGHTTGWYFDNEEDFRCSCGDTLGDCPLYTRVSARYTAYNLQFDIRNFGTKYELISNERLNRYLTASLPLIANSRLETLRDQVIRSFAPSAQRIEQQNRANFAFITSVMNYANASIFVDNSHDPYRLRHLTAAKQFSLSTLHLVRDPRGVALSCIKHAGWTMETSIKIWLRRQSDICRIANEIGRPILRVYYEDLCTNVDETLAKIHEFSGEIFESFKGDFSEVEHHILGNAMRLRGGKIRLDERWRSDLSKSQIELANSLLEKSISSSREPELAEIVRHYLDAR